MKYYIKIDFQFNLGSETVYHHFDATKLTPPPPLFRVDVDLGWPPPPLQKSCILPCTGGIKVGHLTFEWENILGQVSFRSLYDHQKQLGMTAVYVRSCRALDINKTEIFQTICPILTPNISYSLGLAHRLTLAVRALNIGLHVFS